MILTRNSQVLPSEKKLKYSIAALSLLLLSYPASATESPNQSVENLRKNDPHYTESGFFDIHVCNWPDRKLFFMPLFSTIHYRDIRDITVKRPDGKILTSLDLNRFKLLKQKGKPEKRVFMKQVDIPENTMDGWYTATVNMADGTQITAKDYVLVSRLPRASNLNPPDGAEQIAIPKKLTWEGVGQGFYQVFIHDNWNDGKLIYSSKMLDKPELVLPPGLLEGDGLYSWQVHARDVNEDVKLGDFNKGSLSQIATFSTSSEQ